MGLINLGRKRVRRTGSSLCIILDKSDRDIMNIKEGDVLEVNVSKSKGCDDNVA